MKLYGILFSLLFLLNLSCNDSTKETVIHFWGLGSEGEFVKLLIPKFEDEKELVEKAIANQPDVIIINSVLSGKQDIVQTIRFEKGLENVLFLVYQ